MGRRYPFLWRQHSYIQIEESGDPGCVWGLLRFLNYHQHWRNVKKILPHKKHGAQQRSKNNKGKEKARNRLKSAADDEPNHVQVSKRSIKTRIRELMAKEENSQRRVSYMPEQPDHFDQVYSPSKDNKTVEDVDFLELFKVNKQLFLQMLNDHELHNKGRLTKSGSFPSVNSARMKELGPCKLDDKQREIWPPNTKSDAIQPTSTSKGKLSSMRRATSLTESMDRYSQLFGSTSSFNKDIKRNLSSRSLKVVINENDEPTPKFRRRPSLPECDYEAFLPNSETSRQVISKDSAEPCEEVMNKEMNEGISHMDPKDDVQEAIDRDSQESQGLVPVSEVLETVISETHKIHQSLSAEDLEDEESNPEFHYVKLVLELSGFTAKGQTWVWYTIEKPLKPSIFEEIEKQYYPFEQLECATKMEENKRDRRLIFDLMNEALVEIDESSCLYYPRALSSSCRVHLIPKGARLLEEVWSFVAKCLSWRPELDPALDLAAAQDLNGRNGWMNLQIESECVALELEDMILDELLNDVIRSCS